MTRPIEGYDEVLIGKDTNITTGLPPGAVVDPEDHYTVYKHPRRDEVWSRTKEVLKDYRARARIEAKKLGIADRSLRALLAGRSPARATATL